MKIFSIQGIILLVLVYAIIDRSANWTSYYDSKFSASYDKKKKGLGFDFSWQSMLILLASSVIVYFVPKIF